MTVEVIKPGLHTTVQDAGRWGYQRYGVSVSGPMDGFALRVANILVDNPDEAAVLELTLHGPELKLLAPCWIAVCGADMRPQAAGRPVPMWRPVHMPAGTVLTLGRAVAGCRAYIAFAGGIQTAYVLGSRSTHARSQLGGLQGRALLEGDMLPLGIANLQKTVDLALRAEEQVHTVPWFVSSSICPDYAASAVVRSIAAPESDMLGQEVADRFYAQSYQVAPESDRMGIRLIGERIDVQQHTKSMHSSPVTFGTVQLPPSGNPIVLGADRQTMGGYPRIAQIASVDLPILAQLRPGDELSFQHISHAEAERLAQQLEHDLTMLRSAVRLAVW